MYYSIFSSSEYYSDDDTDDSFTYDNCLICLMPANNVQQLTHLSNFKHIYTDCKCNPMLHMKCLNKWIENTQSCPICRTKITVSMINTHDNNMLVYWYVYCIQYTVNFFKLICYASFVNLIVILFYNTYYVLTITQTYNIDNHEVY